MLIEQDAHPTTNDPCAIASRLVADLPADQALGLRLIALARAAAAIHMNTAASTREWSPGIDSIGACIDRDSNHASAYLAHSQAARLLNPEACP